MMCPPCLRDLSARLVVPFAPDGAGWRVSLAINGIATTVGCEVRVPAVTCVSGDATVTIPPGSALSLRFDQIMAGNFAPADVDAEVGWRAMPG